MGNRKIVMVVAGIVVLLVLLWATWNIEGRPTEKKAVSDPKTFSYTLKEKKSDIPKDVLIYCTEDTMDESSAAFAKWLGLEGLPLPVPGGSLFIAKMNMVKMGEELAPAQRVTIEILKRYSPKRIILVAHTECLYYDTMAAWQNSLGEVRKRQIDDLYLAVNLLKEWLPSTEIRVFLAEKKLNQLVFSELEKQQTQKGGQ